MQQTSKEILLNGSSVTIGASETNTVVSDVIRIQDPLHIRIDVKCSGVTAATGVTAKIQDSVDKTVWNTKGSEGNVAITANGTFSIALLAENSSDQAELPLRPFVRVVVTSGAGDAATVTSVMASYMIG